MKPLIDFNQFLQAEVLLDIRIGTIKGVTRINKKMLSLTVDLGEENPRQVVTNIGNKIADIELLNELQFPFVTNLQPAVISGLEYTAMIMIVENNKGEFEWPSRNVMFTPGAKLF